jgi:hypothetical protein
MLLKRPLDDAVEFMFVSYWDSMAAVERYAGVDPERPKYYPEDRAALLDLPDRVDHFEVVDLQAPGR